MIKLFQAHITDFHLIPYVRMTQRGKYVKAAALKYRKNQNDLAWLFKAANQVVDNGVSIDSPVAISFEVGYADNRLRDVDNILKAIADSLQRAGVLANDRWIRGIECSRVYFGLDKPYVKIILEDM